jgi:hypothetical protein
MALLLAFVPICLQFTLRTEICIIYQVRVKVTHMKGSARLYIVDIKVSVNVDCVFNNLRIY